MGIVGGGALVAAPAAGMLADRYGAVRGAAIDLLHPIFRSTDGYAAMWPLIGTTTLLSIAFLKSDG